MSEPQDGDEFLFLDESWPQKGAKEPRRVRATGTVPIASRESDTWPSLTVDRLDELRAAEERRRTEAKKVKKGTTPDGDSEPAPAKEGEAPPPRRTIELSDSEDGDGQILHSASANHYGKSKS